MGGQGMDRDRQIRKKRQRDERLVKLIGILGMPDPPVCPLSGDTPQPHQNARGGKFSGTSGFRSSQRCLVFRSGSKSSYFHMHKKLHSDYSTGTIVFLFEAQAT